MLVFALLWIGAGSDGLATTGGAALPGRDPKAGVAVHLEEVEGVSGDDAQSIALSLAAAIETRTASAAVVDETLWACDAEDRCAAAIRARTGSEAIVFLRVFGGPASVRLSAEVLRARGGDEAAAQAGLSVERGRAVTREMLAPLAAALFAPGVPRAAVELDGGALRVPVVPRSRSIAPWVLLGGGAVAAGVGAVFGVSALEAKSAVETRDHPGAETDRLEDRQRVHGIAATGLIAAGVCAAAGAIVWWIVE